MSGSKPMAGKAPKSTAAQRSKRGRPPRTPAEIAAFRSSVAEVAEQLFRSEGYRAISMRRLALEVGCTPPTLYNHFRGKSEILSAIWTSFFHELFAELSARVAAIADPRARIYALAHGYVDYWLQHEEQYRMVFMTEGVSQADVGSFLSNSDTVACFSLLINAVRDALGHEYPAADLKARSDALISALHGIVQHHLTVQAYPWTPAETLAELTVDGLLSPATQRFQRREAT